MCCLKGVVLLRNWGLSLQCWWRVCNSIMWRYVNWYTGTDVSENHPASICRLVQRKHVTCPITPITYLGLSLYKEPNFSRDGIFSATLQMEAASFSETWLQVYWLTYRRIREDLNLWLRCFPQIACVGLCYSNCLCWAMLFKSVFSSFFAYFKLHFLHYFSNSCK